MTDRIGMRMARSIGVAIVSLLLIVGGAFAANNLISTATQRDVQPAASVAPGAATDNPTMNGAEVPGASESTEASEAPDASKAPEASGEPAGQPEGTTTGPGESDDHGGSLTGGDDANEAPGADDDTGPAGPQSTTGHDGSNDGNNNESSSTSEHSGGQG